MKSQRAVREPKPWAWFSDLPWFVRAGLAAILGAIGAFGQAPYNAPLVLLLCAALAFLMFRRSRSARSAALVGWAFGAGYFAHALFWIVEPFQVDAQIYGWMAPFALVFLSSGLALFWAAAFWGARRLSPRAWPLIATWALAEVARAYLFTGFPWAGFGQIVVDGMAGRALAIAGPHGTTFWLLGIAWLLSFPAAQRRRGALRAAQVVLFMIMGLVLHLPPRGDAAALTDHTVRLIQPNAPQHLKWRSDMVETFYSRQLEFTAAPPTDASAPPDLVIWPETAVPWWMDEASPVLQEIATAARDVPVALGMLRAEDGLARNALVLVGFGGEITAVYDKHHLVPFGEYLPFPDLWRGIGLQGLAASRGPGFGAGPGPAVLEFGTIGAGVPLICYEAVFAHDVRRAPRRADFLLQITNDAWFGRWAGPQQHLAQARMRAIEQGLPLMRAANTGISAMIDPNGRIIAQLDLGVAGFLDAPLPRAAEPTLYSRYGDLPVLLTLLALAAISRLLGKRSTRRRKRSGKND